MGYIRRWWIVCVVGIGLVALLWWLGGILWAALVGVLGLGAGGKLLQEYMEAEHEHHRERAREQQQLQQELQELDVQRKANREHLQRELQRAREKALETASRAESIEALQKQQDKALASFDEWLRKQDGFVRISLKWWLCGLCLLWWLVMQLCGAVEVHARPPTQAEKERAAKLFAVLRRAKATISYLKKKHVLALKREKQRCRSLLKQRELEIRREQKQKQLLVKHRCPPHWPMFVWGGLAGAVSVGFVWGAVALGRRGDIPK